MFERYTEKARRTIFFARYEASQFGSLYIETEHLLLGLLREDKALAHRFLPSHSAVESIRKQIERHTPTGEKVPTSVDLPLSHECKRVLSYGAEEAERLSHKHLGTEHLLLGLLREEKSFAAQLLREQGLSLESLRAQVHLSGPAQAQRESASMKRLRQWLAEREARGGIWAVEQTGVGRRTTDFGIYAGDPAKENETGEDMSPAEKLAYHQKRLWIITKTMERAIANHEFEKARFYSGEERKERENLRLLREQFNLEEAPPLIPLLCIEIIRDERLSEVQERCTDYIREGVAEVWILDPNSKRAYTVTKTEGFREFKGEILQIGNPPLEMDLRRIFD
jgi:ATP-dependent Clp protease ATP-binding subunit ClpA